MIQPVDQSLDIQKKLFSVATFEQWRCWGLGGRGCSRVAPFSGRPSFSRLLKFLAILPLSGWIRRRIILDRSWNSAPGVTLNIYTPDATTTFEVESSLQSELEAKLSLLKEPGVESNVNIILLRIFHVFAKKSESTTCHTNWKQAILYSLAVRKFWYTFEILSLRARSG